MNPLIPLSLWLLPVIGVVTSIAGLIQTKLFKCGSFFLSVIALFLNLGLLIFFLLTHRCMVYDPQGCDVNLKNIAANLEIYATDNNGRYPLRLDKLVETGYVKTLPTCPGRGHFSGILVWPVTVWPDFIIGMDEGHGKPYGYTASSPDSINTYTMWCGHPKTHSNTDLVLKDGCWPQYTPDKGVMFKP